LPSLEVYKAPQKTKFATDDIVVPDGVQRWAVKKCPPTLF
jgi:hypothetical protein